MTNVLSEYHPEGIKHMLETVGRWKQTDITEALLASVMTTWR